MLHNIPSHFMGYEFNDGETLMPILPPTTPTPTPIAIQDAIGSFFISNIIPILSIIAVILILSCIIVFIKSRKKSMRKKMVARYEDFNVATLKVKFYRNIANIMHEIGTEDIKVDSNKFKFKDKDFSILDRSKIAFSDNENKYYAFDYDTTEQLTFKRPNHSPKVKEIIDLLDTWINKNVIQQLTAGLEHPAGTKSLIIAIFVSLAIGLICGVLVGYFGHSPAPQQSTQTAKAFVGAIINAMS